mgnify:CR=1 FL=1
MDLVSIIVPVYNIEKWIERCVQSLINQTYQNLEIILVDDGSTDESGKICDELAKKDDRIKVYHKPNGGVSSARNYGLEKATGKYISFCDSDDEIKITMIETLVSEMKSHNVDLVQCGYVLKNKEQEINYISTSRTYDINNEEDLFQMLSSPVLHISSVFTKLFKKEKLNQIRFKEDVDWGEDQIFVFEYLKIVKKFFYIGEVLYVYNYFNSTPSQKMIANYIDKCEIGRASCRERV